MGKPLGNEITRGEVLKPEIFNVFLGEAKPNFVKENKLFS